jgi:hypothetical protein
MYTARITKGCFTVQNQSFFDSMGDSSYRLNFDQGKKNEIQHHS